MTGADVSAVATTRRRMPEIASSGLIATWTGAVPGTDGRIVRASLQEAAALAKAAAEDGDDPVVLALEGPIRPQDGPFPWSLVEAVHLPSESAAKEYSARAFDNFDPGERPVLVTTDAFVVEPSQPGTDSGAPPAALAAFDRQIGAAACAAAVPVPETLGNPRDRLVEVLSSGDHSSQAVTSALRGLLTTDADDQKLMAVMVAAVIALDPTAPVGARRFVGDVAEAVEDPHDRTRAALEAAMDVLKGKKELPPLKENVGLRSVKALLLFALRPEPHDAVAWAADMPHDPSSVLVAAALAGLRCGWARLPVALRGPTERRGWFEAHLADASRAGTSVWSTDMAPVTGEIREEPEQAEPEEASGADGSGQLSLVDSQEVPGDEDPLRTVVRLAAAADLEDAAVAVAAAGVCVKHGWEELVTTVLEVGRRPYIWTGKAVEVEGAPVVKRRIDPAFIGRLEAYEGRLSAEIRALGAVLGAPKRPTRRKKAT